MSKCLQFAQLGRALLIQRAAAHSSEASVQLLAFCVSHPETFPLGFTLGLSSRMPADSDYLPIFRQLNQTRQYKLSLELWESLAETLLTPSRELQLEVLLAANHSGDLRTASGVLAKSAATDEELHALAVDTAFRAGNLDRAMELYQAFPKPAALMLSCLVRNYAKIHSLSVALDFFTAMKLSGLRLDTDSMNSLLDACVRNAELEKATEILSYQQSAGCPFDQITCSIMVRAYARAGQLDPALSLLDSINPPPDESIFNLLLDCCAKAGRLQSAFELIHKMGRLGVRAGVVTYNSLMDACIRTDSSARAWDLLEEMRRAGMRPDSYTYSTLFRGIRGESQQSELARALEMVRELERDPEFVPDTILYNVLLDACVSARMMHSAEELLERMSVSEKARPDEISYNTLLKGCGQTKDFLRAFDLFSEMKSKGVKPNAVTFNTLIDVCTKCGKTTRGWELLDEMEGAGLTPDNFTCSTLIKGLRRGYSTAPLDKAFELLSYMKGKKNATQPDEVLYNCLMDACVKFGETARAVSVFKEMSRAGVAPGAVTHGILIRAYGQSGQLGNALRTFNKMKEAGHTPGEVAYGCIIDACIRNGELDTARSMYRDMQKDGVKPNTVICTIMIKGFSKAHNLDGALDIYERMKADPDCLPNNITYNSLLDCCVRCEKLKMLETVFEEMNTHGVAPDLITFSTLIKGYCRQTKMTAAFKTLERMTQAGIAPDEVLFNSLLDGCARAGQAELGFQVFESMQLKGIPPSNVTNSIMEKIIGRTKMPEKMAAEMLIRLKGNGSAAATCLLKILIQTKGVDSAVDLYKMISAESHVRLEATDCSMLIRSCMRDMKTTRAGEVCATAVRQNPGFAKEEVCRDVLDALHRISKGNEAAAKLAGEIEELINGVKKKTVSASEEKPLETKTRFRQVLQVSSGMGMNTKARAGVGGARRKPANDKEEEKGGDENTNTNNGVVVTMQKRSKFTAFIQKGGDQGEEKSAAEKKEGFVAKPISFGCGVFSFRNSKKADTGKENAKVPRLV